MGAKPILEKNPTLAFQGQCCSGEGLEVLSTVLNVVGWARGLCFRDRPPSGRGANAGDWEQT
jgi:hypothetical protein